MAKILEVFFEPVDNARLAKLCGVLDENLRQIENAFDITVSRRAEHFTLQGHPAQVLRGEMALKHFYALADKDLSRDEVQLGLIEIANKGEAAQPAPVLMTRRTELHGRTPRQVDGVNTFAGPASLQGFLAGLDVLVNLLPLTASTHGVLNHAVFRHMAEGSALINCGRGQHLNPHDLRQALASGQLRGALLDVFEQEPLPADSPLWHTPGVWVTPHMASAASDLCIARQVADNVSRLSAGLALNNLVDPELGY